MLIGSLFNSFNDRGFTFISVEGESSVKDRIFLHVSQVANDQDIKSFVRGAQVQFELVYVNKNGEEKPQARNIRLIAKTETDESAVSSTARHGSVKFWHPLGYGFVFDLASNQEYYVKASSVPGGYLRQGDAIQFDVETGSGTASKGEAVNVSVIGWDRTGDAFADTLDMGSPRWANQLAALAEDEDWNYRVHPAKDPYTILRSYMKYSFLRLNELADHVMLSHDETALSFNTGLVTPFQEQIFALFQRREINTLGPAWLLRGFEKASSVSFLGLFGKNLPPLASYYDEPAQLVFDTRLPLSVNVEHVPHDPARFPDNLNSLSPHDLAAQVNVKAPEAIERVRRNYKTAIPQFYRDGKSRKGKMQLLLPIALLRRDHAELALAVDRLDSGVYLGRTVLTLDWAYNNARLLTRPDTDWLKP